MEYFDDGSVIYLEDDDFSNDGKFLHDTDKHVIILIQANYCGYCTQIKPAYKELAKNLGKKFVFCTVQMDGNEKGASLLADKLRNFIPNFNGVPMVVSYKNNRFNKEYQGDRSLISMTAFCESL
jgi:thiol-disulfide isomerase/thioredoxin